MIGSLRVLEQAANSKLATNKWLGANKTRNASAAPHEHK
jgi:hypothetical protein